MAATPEQMAAWMQQWRRAAVALVEVERRELAALTDERALEQTESLLSLVEDLPIQPETRAVSGLVQQQAVFQKLRQ